MSIYEDSKYIAQMNYIYDEMKDFLEEHPVYELLQVVADVIAEKESED